MKSSTTIIGFSYRWLPLLPPLVLLGLFSFALLRRTQNQKQFEKQLTEDFGVSAESINLASIINVNASNLHTDKWLRVLQATQRLNGDNGQFYAVITDPETGQQVVPTGKPYKAKPIIAAYVRDAKPIVAEISMLAKNSDASWVQIVDDGNATVLNELQMSRGVSRLLATEFVVAFHDGENEIALSALKLMDHLFKIRGREYTSLIGQLVSQANAFLALRLINESLQYDQWTDAELDQINSLLQSFGNIDQLWDSCIRGESAMIVMGMSDSKSVDQYSGPSRYLGEGRSSISPGTKIEVLNFLQSVQQQSKGLGALDRLDQVYSWDDGNEWRAFSCDQWLSVPFIGNQWRGDLLSPSLSAFAVQVIRHHGHVRLVRTVLAVREFRRANDRWPAELADLQSTGLPIAETLDPMGNPIEMTQLAGDTLRVNLRGYARDHPGRSLVDNIDPIVLRGAKE